LPNYRNLGLEPNVMTGADRQEAVIMEEVPRLINDSEILSFLRKKDIDWRYLNAFRNMTDFNDDIISEWLNVSVKTFREYRKPDSVFKENVKEHVLLLLSLFAHGIEVFGSRKEFGNWLTTDNFHFDRAKPETFLNTVTGIMFIDDRLTGMEYGDNA
jgi:uncharacterized protein (DUF2384 family)